MLRVNMDVTKMLHSLKKKKKIVISLASNNNGEFPKNVQP